MPGDIEESFLVKEFRLDGRINKPQVMTHFPNRGFNVAVIASSYRSTPPAIEDPSKNFVKGTEISLVSFDFDPSIADGSTFMTTLYTESWAPGGRMTNIFVHESDGYEHIYFLGLSKGLWRIKTDIAGAISSSAKGFRQDQDVFVTNFQILEAQWGYPRH